MSEITERKNSGVTEKRPIRILHVLGVLNMGGAESRIMDLYRTIDREQVQFDFLVHTDARPEGENGAVPTSEALMAARKPDYYDEEVRSLGGRIYALPRYRLKTAGLYRKAVEQFFAEHGGWVAVEGHMTSLAAIYLPIAKKSGIPHTIAHVRSGGVSAGLKGLATKWMRRDLPKKADILLTCAMDAGVAVYGKRAERDGRIRVVPNAIDTEAFRFSAEDRKQIRAELGIPEDAFVIGHVGRFDPMKNHAFLAGVLKALCGGAGRSDSAQNAVKSTGSAGETGTAHGSGNSAGTGTNFALLLVGSGKLEEDVKRQLSEAGLADKAFFAGQCSRERTAGMYQAMDLFCLPSLYEGLPGTVVEAQAAGLPCLVSDRVTKEVCLTPDTKQLPVGSGDESAWADEICGISERSAAGNAASNDDRASRSEAFIELLGAAGYDIHTQAAQMRQFYLDIK